MEMCERLSNIYIINYIVNRVGRWRHGNVTALKRRGPEISGSSVPGNCVYLKIDIERILTIDIGREAAPTNMWRRLIAFHYSLRPMYVWQIREIISNRESISVKNAGHVIFF